MPNEYRIGRLKGRYAVSWWVDGKRRRHRLDALTRKEAEAEAVDVIRRETIAPKTVVFADLWAAYLKEKFGRRITVTMAFEWKVVGPHFGHLRPDQITVETSRAFTALRRAAGKHDGTIWTELGHVRTVLRWAYGDSAPRIERPAKPQPKDRYLTPDEIDRLIAAPCAPHIKLAILLMLSTGARVTAVLELTWDRVDFDAGKIDLRANATGPRKGRAVVPMNDGLRAALFAAERAATTDNVIEWAGQPIVRIRTGFDAAVKSAGLSGVSPHVLRHTAGVTLAAAGVPMQKISQYLGHSSTAVTERVYARFAPDHMREEAQLLDFTTKARMVG